MIIGSVPKITNRSKNLVELGDSELLNELRDRASLKYTTTLKLKQEYNSDFETGFYEGQLAALDLFIKELWRKVK